VPESPQWLCLSTPAREGWRVKVGILVAGATVAEGLVPSTAGAHRPSPLSKLRLVISVAKVVAPPAKEGS
jgi:hypothetical protein